MRVCFVAENAWPVVSKRSKLPFGGMETQAWAFARCLQQMNCCEVSFAVSSPERFREETHAGISVFNRRAFFEHVRRQVSQHCVIQHSWPPLRIRRWSKSLLWQLPLLLLRRLFGSADDESQSIAAFYADLPVDIVIAFGVSSLTTRIVEAARASGKRTVISCASNDDLRSEYRSDSEYVNAYGDSGPVLARGLLAADRVFVQTPWQQKIAAANLKLKAAVLPNPVDEEWQRWAGQSEYLLADLVRRYPQLSKNFVLWTGRTERFHKRPEMAFDVARRLPHHQFVMVLNVTDPVYAKELDLKRPLNILVLPAMPHAQFVALMSRATAFLSTGSRQYEGFPNVFLQAGMLGVPVVSADCDFGILSETGIGRSFDDSVSEMADSLNEICNSPERRRELIAGVEERTRNLYGSGAVAVRLWDLLNDMGPDTR